MQLKDYKYYQKTSKGGCKSQIKDFINLYIKILKKVKKESSSELDGVKINIKKSYPEEVYLTLIDENNKPIRLTLTEKSKKYVIPIFTDVCEYDEGREKLSKLFIEEFEQTIITPYDIKKLGEDDENFKGIVINPHSQNFRMDTDGQIWTSSALP